MYGLQILFYKNLNFEIKYQNLFLDFKNILEGKTREHWLKKNGIFLKFVNICI